MVRKGSPKPPLSRLRLTSLFWCGLCEVGEPYQKWVEGYFGQSRKFQDTHVRLTCFNPRPPNFLTPLEDIDKPVIAAMKGVAVGAGLDTFACRNPYPVGVLHVFEVDYSATQVWKRTRLKEEGIPIPETLTFIPTNFETQTLDDGLRQGGFDTSKTTFFSWLGVTPYLTSSAVTAALQFVASMPVGSGIVFDYMISPSLLTPTARRAFHSLAHRVALAGEPFRPSFLRLPSRAVS